MSADKPPFIYSNPVAATISIIVLGSPFALWWLTGSFIVGGGVFLVLALLYNIYYNNTRAYWARRLLKSLERDEQQQQRGPWG